MRNTLNVQLIALFHLSLADLLQNIVVPLFFTRYL